MRVRVDIYIYIYMYKLIQIRMNGLDETVREYMYREKKKKSLEPDRHTYTLDGQ